MQSGKIHIGAIRFVPLMFSSMWLVSCGQFAWPQATQETPTEEPTEMPPPTATIQYEECASPRITGEISAEEYAWTIQVLEHIEPGITELDEVIQLLGEPTDEGYQDWIYDPDFGWVGLYIAYGGDEIIDFMRLWRPMTIGQLVETYGEPSRVFRSNWGELAADYPGLLTRTLLFYDERHMAAEIRQGLCEFPPEVIVERIFVNSPDMPLNNVLTHDAVEIEWPGLAGE
jgi:hypothetical protein